MTLETWRPVPEWPAYEVSDIGRVRSVDRTATDSAGRTVRLRGQVKRTWIDGGGYRRVELSDGGRRFGPGVHRLMLLAFVGPPAAGQETRHLDGDSLNNTLANLAWGTHSENVRDIKHHGRYRHRNAEKQQCPSGHPYSGRNSRGDRVCHTCMRERQRTYVRRRRAA